MMSIKVLASLESFIDRKYKYEGHTSCTSWQCGYNIPMLMLSMPYYLWMLVNMILLVLMVASPCPMSIQKLWPKNIARFHYSGY